ncbi:hypothetical protein ACFL08_04195 [Patescibacteria group bacterium]
MGFKLVEEVDYKGTEKVSLESWQAEFDFLLMFIQIETEINNNDCSEEPEFDEINGYCEFFSRECSRCSLSKYQVGLEDEDGGVTDNLCNKHGGIIMGCLMEHDHEAVSSAISVKLEAIKRDGIRWGYYPTENEMKKKDNGEEMKIQLLGRVQKIPFENWFGTFCEALDVVSFFENKVLYEGEKFPIERQRSYCSFFEGNCEKCLLSSYNVCIEGGAMLNICGGEFSLAALGNRLGCEGEIDKTLIVVRKILEAIREDGINWGYYAPEK